MNVGDEIDIPILIGTKGGGKRRIGTGTGKIIHIGKKFITVWNGRYTETFTYKELEVKPKEEIK